MVCSSDYQQNWEKSSQAETTKDYQRCHSNTRRITQGLEKTCTSSPLIACMWWCFRGRTLLNHLQRAQGKWGSMKSVWESVSKMPVLCYSGEELQTIQCTWSNSLAPSHSLTRVYFCKRSRELGYCKYLLL